MNKVITISCKFGSKKRTIGKEVTEKLRYAFYDKELIKKIAEDLDFLKSILRHMVGLWNKHNRVFFLKGVFFL